MNADGPPRSVPWTLGHVVRAYVAVVACSTLLVVAWWQASGETRTGPQLQWTAVAVAALIVAGTVGSVWFMAGRRAVGERRARLVDLLHARTDGQAGPAGAPGYGGSATAVLLVASPDMSRYHRGECLLVQGKAVTAASLATHRRRGRRPCGVCRP